MRLCNQRSCRQLVRYQANFATVTNQVVWISTFSCSYCNQNGTHKGFKCYDTIDTRLPRQFLDSNWSNAINVSFTLRFRWPIWTYKNWRGSLVSICLHSTTISTLTMHQTAYIYVNCLPCIRIQHLSRYQAIQLYTMSSWRQIIKLTDKAKYCLLHVECLR